jgi:hypothetical protein
MVVAGAEVGLEVRRARHTEEPITSGVAVTSYRVVVGLYRLSRAKWYRHTHVCHVECDLEFVKKNQNNGNLTNPTGCLTFVAELPSRQPLHNGVAGTHSDGRVLCNDTCRQLT